MHRAGRALVDTSLQNLPPITAVYVCFARCLEARAAVVDLCLCVCAAEVLARKLHTAVLAETRAHAHKVMMCLLPPHGRPRRT